MKILAVTNSGGDGRVQYGGAEALLSDLLPALRDRGHVIEAICPRGRLFDELTQQRISPIELAPTRWFDPAYVKSLRLAITESNPDVISFHLLSASMHGRVASRSMRIPHTVALHTNLDEVARSVETRKAKLKVRLTLAIDRRLARTTGTRYVAVSDLDLLRLRQRGRDAVLIRNGLPAQWPQPPSVGATGQQSDIIGFLGRHEPEKGYDRLVELAERNQDLRFRCAGTGSLAASVLPPNLECVGELSQPANFLSELSVLVVPSRWEIFGRVALEALSLGVHVVHSGVGGLGEHDPDLVNSSIVKPWDTDAVAEALRRRLTLPRPTEQQVGLAHDICNSYGFEHSTDRWAQVLSDIQQAPPVNAR